MKKLLVVFFNIIIYYSIILHANAMELQPNDIFESQKGTRFVLSNRTTGADKLHAENIEGEIKGDRALVVAIIDQRFHPKYSVPFKEKDLIHPDVFSKDLIFDPADNFKTLIFEHDDNFKKLFWLPDEINFKKECIDILTPSFPPEEIQNLADFIKKLTMNQLAQFLEKKGHNPKVKPLLKNVHYCREFSFQNSSTHGSGVMEAVHAIAPKACFFPIDLAGFASDNSGDGKFAWAIRTAIHYNVDVINLSVSPSELNAPGMIKACKEAIDKGIPLIIAAGNDSTKKQAQFISLVDRALFDALDERGILFAGALRYTENGQEVVADFTQHPTKKMEKHFMCAAGSELLCNAHSYLKGSLGWSLGLQNRGTSFAAPEIAGGYILLKQIARMHNYPATSQELLDILYDSGRSVSCTVSLPVDPDSESLIVDSMKRNKTYKSMDLVNAKKMLEEKIKAIKPVSKNSGRPLPPIPRATHSIVSK